MTTLTDFTANRIDGTPLSFAELKGQVLLIVNTASECRRSIMWSRRARKKSSVAASANIKISQKLMSVGIQTGSSGYP